MNYYETLGIDRGASPEQIHRAYRVAAAQHHPDADGDPEHFKKVAAAYECLSDPDRRKRYDETGIDRDSPQNEPQIMILFHFLKEATEAIIHRDDQRTGLFEDIRRRIRKALKDFTTAKDSAEAVMERLDVAIDKITAKNKKTKNETGLELVLEYLTGDRAKTEADWSNLCELVEGHQKAIGLVEGLEHANEMPPYSARTSPGPIAEMLSNFDHKTNTADWMQSGSPMFYKRNRDDK